MPATTSSIQKNLTTEKNINPPSSDAPSGALGDRRGELFIKAGDFWGKGGLDDQSGMEKENKERVRRCWHL